MSAIKREAVTLYEQLRVVELKRNELLIEEQERGTPGQVCFVGFLQHGKQKWCSILVLSTPIPKPLERNCHLLILPKLYRSANGC